MRRMSPTPPTEAPIPAWAPVERPELEEGVEVEVGVIPGSEVVVVSAGGLVGTPVGGLVTVGVWALKLAFSTALDT